MRWVSRAVLATAVAIAAVESTVPRATSSVAEVLQATVPKRVVDTTLVCSTTFVGGARDIEVKGHRGTGRAGSTWGRPAVVAVTTGPSANGGPQNPTILDNSLTWVTAGRPSATSTLVEEHILSSLYPTRTWGTLAINGRLCGPTKRRVTLGVRGLELHALGPFEDSFTCATPRRVVLRVRAVLTSPAVLRSYRAFARATIPVREAQLAVQTESGKRLAYAEVLESGKARLFTARSCFPS